MPTQAKAEHEIDEMLRQLGEAFRPVLAQFNRAYKPVSAQTALRRAEAERRMRCAETAFRAELNQEARPVPLALNHSQIQRIRELYQQGVGPTEIAQRSYVSVDTVERHTRDLPRSRKPYPPLSRETVAELYALLDAGTSARAAAIKLGVHPSTALRYRNKRAVS